MNFIEEEERGYISDREEQDEDEEEVIITSKLSLSSPANSPSSSSNKNKSFLTQPQSLWFGDSNIEARQDHKNQEEPHLNFNKKLELMDLSLGSNNEADKGGGGGASASGPIEREHMFDKVVTPSDVGKLNRLVIPKQHAEKYFPLDSSSNEKGLLLNFEDRGGKPWRFRYSYWNSSQSYVMTKGWSRFVKEKKLDAGDIVSFQRGVGEEGKHRLFIDWRRRPNVPDPASFTRLEVQNQLHFPQSVRWGRLYSLPPSLSMPRQYHEQPPIQQSNYGIQPYQHHHNQQYHYHHQPATSYGAAAHYYLTPQVAHPIGTLHHQGVVDHAPLVIDSVPVAHGKTVGKRLRLFGVNMTTAQDEPSSSIPVSHDSTVGTFSPPVQLRISEDALPATQAEFSKKGAWLSWIAGDARRKFQALLKASSSSGSLLRSLFFVVGWHFSNGFF